MHDSSITIKWAQGCSKLAICQSYATASNRCFSLRNEHHLVKTLRQSHPFDKLRARKVFPSVVLSASKDSGGQTIGVMNPATCFFGRLVVSIDIVHSRERGVDSGDVGTVVGAV